ncbi:rhodanese-like domain-containing protein [Phreatobacter sp.]|uniref:rhodanese-like domain-containing protein n=1 Tax=Phreatobacter sp. TaxID=1966341 RepID=UPI003F711297
METTFEAISREADAQLIDVRTTAEWAYVGSPDLKGLDKDAIRIEWQVFPHMGVNPDFVARLAAALAARGVQPSAKLYFLCRSGVRSKAAAIAATEAGFASCFNVAGGFEGPPDAGGHRGRVAGWKAAGLPWIQP